MVTSEVKDRFKRSLYQDVYNTQWFKPLLLVLEYGQVEQTLSYIELDNKIHVEHILPERYRRHEYWRELYTPDQADLYLNSLANFTLLSGKQNILASNNPFPDKMFIYDGKGKDGLVPFRISQWVRDHHNNGMTDWDIPALKKRFDWIIEEISTEFDIDLSDMTFEKIGKSEEVFQYTESNVEADSEATEPVSFHAECIKYVEKKLNKKFDRFTTTLYRTRDCTAICKASKEYTRSGKGYWYGFTAGEKELLAEDPSKNILILGLGDPTKTLVIPAQWMLEQLENLNITVRPSNMYWHIQINDRRSRLYLTHKGGEEIEVTEFLLK